jgi:hypothetical protein
MSRSAVTLTPIAYFASGLLCVRATNLAAHFTTSCGFGKVESLSQPVNSLGEASRVA